MHLSDLLIDAASAIIGLIDKLSVKKPGICLTQFLFADSPGPQFSVSKPEIYPCVEVNT
jgi:hypothetical protein